MKCKDYAYIYLLKIFSKRNILRGIVAFLFDNEVPTYNDLSWT